MPPLLSKVILLAARMLQRVIAQVRILLAEKYYEVPYYTDEFDVAVVSTMFLCNICRDNPKVPVITLCGHVYCWLCVKKWYSLKEKPSVCPVCRGHNEENDLIPIHPRGVKINYGNKCLLEDSAYKETFSSYEGVMGDLMKKSCRGIRYFLSITKLQNVQIGVGWGLFGCLFLYYWVAVYR